MHLDLGLSIPSGRRRFRQDPPCNLSRDGCDNRTPRVAGSEGAPCFGVETRPSAATTPQNAPNRAHIRAGCARSGAYNRTKQVSVELGRGSPYVARAAVTALLPLRVRVDRKRKLGFRTGDPPGRGMRESPAFGLHRACSRSGRFAGRLARGKCSVRRSPSVFDGFTSEACDAVNLAEEEATRLGRGYVGAEHILLGVRRASRASQPPVAHEDSDATLGGSDATCHRLLSPWPHASSVRQENRRCKQLRSCRP
jgi:hypothetical protein